MNRRNRAGRSTFSNLMLLLVVAGGIGVGYLFGIKWWHAQQMKEIARIVVREWHLSENKKVAEDRMTRELEQYGIPYYIPDGACELKVGESGNKLIDCGWQADVTIPVIEHVVPQEYAFTMEVDNRGKVQEW